MKLNSLENKIVSHPIRWWFQKNIEANILHSYLPKNNLCCQRALEIGCGYGAGIDAISHKFCHGSIYAIDFDPQKVFESSKKHRGKNNIYIAIGDACALDFTDDYFDQVFNFAVFHHIPNWQKAVREVYRVLVPGGYFIIEDLYRAAISNPISKKLFVHPQENRFDHQEFIDYLQLTGFKLMNNLNICNLIGFIVVKKPEFLE